MDKAQLLHEMQVGRESLKEMLAHLNAVQMEVEKTLYDSWSVKDLLAHLGFWERRTATVFKVLQAGDSVPSMGGFSMDEVNARTFTANHGRPLEEVQAEEQAAYQDLQALVEKAPENDLFDPQRFSWTSGQPFFEWIEGDSFGHYQEHLPALQEWVNKTK